jgi:hypothetical protein
LPVESLPVESDDRISEANNCVATDPRRRRQIPNTAKPHFLRLLQNSPKTTAKAEAEKHLRNCSQDITSMFPRQSFCK